MKHLIKLIMCNVILSVWLGRIFIALIAIGFAACENTITTRRVIPEKNIRAADEFIIKQMDAIKITNRYENEDYDDFLLQAKYNALDVYGVDTVGVFESGNGFLIYKVCSVEDKKRIDERLKISP